MVKPFLRHCRPQVRLKLSHATNGMLTHGSCREGRTKMSLRRVTTSPMRVRSFYDKLGIYRFMS